MQRTLINPAIYQELLDSASNAGQKGQAQYHTPIAFGRELACYLPDTRPVIVDLSAGAGHLLHACANETTERLLACDIDPSPERSEPRRNLGEDGATKPKSPKTYPIVADLTKLYPLMVETDFRADLFVLNPPWDLHWYRDRLASLADSRLPGVREAFAAHDGRTSRDTIDSTVATMLMALDRCTTYGEGMIIGNDATIHRLIMAPNAPHRALARHVWSYQTLPSPWAKGAKAEGSTLNAELGNSDPDTSALSPQPSALPQVGVLYFAAGHHEGIARPSLGGSQRDQRQGASIRGTWCCETRTHEKWQAVTEEWSARSTSALSLKPSAFNLWLSPDGAIRTALSLFQQHSSRTDKTLAAELHSLNGKQPMQLVLQRNDRETLERAAFNSPWTVCPQLQAAVNLAVQQYHATRAPLYPLPKIQRLGYLDEQEKILCVKDFSGSDSENSAFSVQPSAFAAGRRYPISSRTVTVSRKGTRPNLSGESEELEYSGQELCISIHDDQGREHRFMEARHTAAGVKVNHTHLNSRRNRPTAGPPVNVHHTLDDLIAHFEIPEVPDVATIAPEAFQKNLQILAQLDQVLAL